MAALNPFGYFEKTSRAISTWGKLSDGAQRREINGWMRVNPGQSERQARKALSEGRRSGRLFRTGTNATEDQEARTIVYQDRSRRSHEAADKRKQWRDRVNNEHGPVHIKYRRPEESPYSREQYKDAETRAYRNMKSKLGHYEEFNLDKIPGRLAKTSMEWLNWIASASEDSLVNLASVDGSIKQKFSPLFYH
jgi:hypothetical protein